MVEEYRPRKITPTPKVQEVPKGVREGQRVEIPGLPGVKAEIPTEEKPLALFEKPYLIDILEFSEKTLNLNPDNLNEKIRIIDAWIKYQISEREWKPNVKSYLELFGEIKEKLNISEQTFPISQINRIFDIIDKAMEDKELKEKLGIDIIKTFSGF